MPDPRHLRISRELFLAAFGPELGSVEPWVTDRLTSLLREEELRAGQALFSAGDPAEFFYFMREGRVQMVREGGAPLTFEGRRVVGMFDVLLDQPRRRTAIALEDLRLMKVRADAWIELLEDSFELARASVVTSARSVSVLEERLWSNAGVRLSIGARTTHVPQGRLNIIERLAVLMDAPPLREAGVQTLSDLAASSDEVFFEEDELLFERNVARERVFMVVEGEVEASRDAPDIVWRVGAGEIVCGAAAFGEPALAWTARARRHTRALAFRVEDWFDRMEEHFDMVRSALAAYARQRDRLLDELASKDAGILVS